MKSAEVVPQLGWRWQMHWWKPAKPRVPTRMRSLCNMSGNGSDLLMLKMLTSCNTGACTLERDAMLYTKCAEQLQCPLQPVNAMSRKL